MSLNKDQANPKRLEMQTNEPHTAGNGTVLILTNQASCLPVSQPRKCFQQQAKKQQHKKDTKFEGWMSDAFTGCNRL